MGFVKKLFTPNTPSVPTPASAAVNAPTPVLNQETGLETFSDTLKRRSRGKRNLTIDPTNGGTGLNV